MSKSKTDENSESRVGLQVKAATVGLRELTQSQHSAGGLNKVGRDLRSF